MTKLFKKPKRLIITVVVVAIVAFIVYGFVSSKGTMTTQIITESAKKGSISIAVSANGSITPQTSYTITPRVSAKVIEVNVKAGDKVKKGQQILKLDDTDLQNSVKIAMYNFNSAIYRRDQLNAAPIKDDNAIKQSQQQVNVTSVQLQMAKNNLNNAIITSPLDGEVLLMNLKVDDFATIAQPAAIIADTATLEATLTVNEIDINKVQSGQDVTLTIDAVNGVKAGKIISIDNNGVNVAGIVNYQVKASITDQTGLKPNMTLDSEIKVQSKIDVITVPAAAIQQKDSKSYIKVVTISNNVETTTDREVTIGLNNNTIAEVVSGISENDKVVINIINKNSGATGLFSFGSSSTSK